MSSTCTKEKKKETDKDSISGWEYILRFTTNQKYIINQHTAHSTLVNNGIYIFFVPR